MSFGSDTYRRGSRDKTPMTKPQYKNYSPQPQNPNPKHKNQRHFIHWRFVRGIMTGYQHLCVPHTLNIFKWPPPPLLWLQFSSPVLWPIYSLLTILHAHAVWPSCWMWGDNLFVVECLLIQHTWKPSDISWMNLWAVVQHKSVVRIYILPRDSARTHV